ncbi:MAG: DUF1273 family protein [Clostridia bacterium]|nr:DUF1273 family protein [Clostridia bacterium]MBQ7897760.1 DUF1273 family protein [Clostridia bacterium]
MEIIKEKTCSFFGHRKIEVTEGLKKRLLEAVEELILKSGVDTFLFGSRSDFDKLSLETVTLLKEKYPHVKRIYVRAEFPYINESYTAYLMKKYDFTYYPEKILNSGKAVYVERNREMIDKSNFCIVFYDEHYTPTKKTVSGTATAYLYALYKKLKVINLF